MTSKIFATMTMSEGLLEGNISKVSINSTRTGGGISSLRNVLDKHSAPFKLK